MLPAVELHGRRRYCYAAGHVFAPLRLLLRCLLLRYAICRHFATPFFHMPLRFFFAMAAMPLPFTRHMPLALTPRR